MTAPVLQIEKKKKKNKKRKKKRKMMRKMTRMMRKMTRMMTKNAQEPDATAKTSLPAVMVLLVDKACSTRGKSLSCA